MKKSNINNKGITLIALVVTIILLIILAGVSISLIFGQRGIIARAIEAKEIQEKGEIREALELAKTNVLNYDTTIFTNLEDYMNYIRDSINNKMILNGYKVTSDEKYNESTYYITVNDKYIYSVAQIENNVIIDEIGSIKKILPKIELLEIEGQTTNSIRVKVEGRVVESYEFYIKEESEEKYSKVGEIGGNNKDNYNIEEISYEYNKLEQGKTYNIKVVAKNKNGSVEKNIERVTLVRIPTPTIEVTDADIWTKLKKVTITTMSGYTTKYTLDGSMPSVTNGIEYNGEFTINKNCIITAVNLDNTGQMDSGSTREVTTVDTLPPTGSITTESTTNSLKVIVNALDQVATSESGSSGIKGYYYSKDGGSNYTNITTDTSYTFTGLTQTSSYNIKVKVEDNAGNITELDKTGSTITVPIPTITVADPDTWTNGTKTITISEASGYTARYTINGTMPSQTNGTTYTGVFTVSSNCTITAVYLDNTNQIGSASTNTITKIDKTPPSVPTVTYNGGSNTCSWKNNYNLSIVSTDSQSGVAYYEVDWTGDGNANGTVASNFIPGNGYSSCNNRFRAVDNVGNRSEWTSSHHIHMDTQAPSTPSIQITNITINQGGWNYTISTSSSDNVGVTYTYKDGYNGEVFGTTTNNSYTRSGSGWFAYGNICVMAKDPAGNESYSSTIYLNSKRLYIRQLYWAMRNNYNVDESEINHWDYDFGKGAIIAVGIMGSNEAHDYYGGDASTYVDRCYLGILGRASDSGGKSSMVSLYNSNNETGMFQAFVNSSEAQNIFNNQGFGAGTVSTDEIWENLRK